MPTATPHSPAARARRQPPTLPPRVAAALRRYGTAWHAAAACSQLVAPLFHTPDGLQLGPDGEQARIRAAKLICSRCPVQRTCLEYAMAAGEPHGIWGGLTPTERHQLARRQATSNGQGAA